MAIGVVNETPPEQVVLLRELLDLHLALENTTTPQFSVRQIEGHSGLGKSLFMTLASKHRNQ